MARRSRLVTLVMTGLLSLLPITVAAQDASPGASPGTATTPPVSYLYVVSGASAMVDDATITLVDAPLVIMFTDRPARSVGHVTAAGFIDGWQMGSDNFADDPPNAALISTDPVTQSIVELTSAELTEDGMRFGYQAIDGVVPTGELGPTSLVIDDGQCIQLADGTWVMWVSINPPVVVPCPG